ncbi:sterile alpha motif domain-containing protein 3-like, partial [Dysidea avara]|uniref:sterile alpha motif domain-containing protein 3-like n=1 Tax=Dysidea avara TaxID=196820 RepID=UPI00332DDE7D
MDIAKCTVDELEAFLTSNLEGRVESPDSVASPFKHHKIDGSAFLKLLPEEIQEIVPIIGERKVVTSIIHSNQESSAITTTKGAVKRTNSDWHSKFKIPQFSRKTCESIEKSQIVKGVRTEIITTIAWEIWQFTQYPTSEDYTTVCKMLVQTHPILKDTIGNGYGSWKLQLRQKLKNMRRPSEASKGGGKRRSESDTSTQETDESISESLPSAKRKRTAPRLTPPPEDEAITLQDLENALQEENCDTGFVKKAMKSTYQARRAWLLQECPPVQEVLQKFPVLETKKYIIREIRYILEECRGTDEIDDAGSQLDMLSSKVWVQANLEGCTSQTMSRLLQSLPDED